MADLILTKAHGLINLPDFHLNYRDIYQYNFQQNTLKVTYLDNHKEIIIFDSIESCLKVEALITNNPNRWSYLPKSPRLKIAEYLGKI